jgi:hypothetical protein
MYKNKQTYNKKQINKIKKEFELKKLGLDSDFPPIKLKSVKKK